MKKLLLIIGIFLSTSAAADEWIRAYPILDMGSGEKYRGLAFQEAYARYCLKDEGKTLEINLHDQEIRSGYWFDRVGNDKFGVFIRGARLFVDAKMLLRVFSLVAGIETQVNKGFGAWWLQPNFVLLDRLLVDDMDAVVQAFTAKHPEVMKITFKTNDTYHPYQITDVDFAEEIENWVTQFSAHGIELEK